MKAKDLQKYKPLDITQISGSPWNSAEKVLGLDDKDKVVMAEPEEVVTPEDVQSAITQAMEAETARTEDTYAKKGELPPLDDYYTKEETNAVVTSATQDMATETWVQSQGYLTEHQDLSAYAKTTAVTQDIQTAMASETARTEDTYAKKSDIPDLDNYYTKSETDEAIAEAVSGISLDGYWTSGQTKDYVDGQITGATASETARTENAYIKKSLYSGYDENSITKVEKGIYNASEGDVVKHFDAISMRYVIPGIGAAGAGVSMIVKKINGVSIIENLSSSVDESISLPTFNDVSTAITAAMTSETARTEQTYAKIGDIPSLDGYWTSAQTESAITAATEGLATEAWVTGDTDTRIGTAMASETARTESVYAKKTDVPSLDGYWTSAETQNAITAETQDMATKTWVGQNYLTIWETSDEINSAIATETARTESTYAKKGDIPSLDGYATEAYVTAATEDMATKTWVGEQGYVTDISGKLDVSVYSAYTGSTATEIAGKLDTSVYSAYTASTETVLSGKVDNSTFTGYTGDTATALAGKVGMDVYSAYTGSTATALAGKQETLVSGTNIKTINNESILGSGNIVIQGGGGGGETVVELTQEQYEALNPPAQDTTYIITDAETVDLNDYAMASGLTEVSGTVATINSNYATKQSVTARASNSNYLPGWNTQGVITGGTAYYNKTQGINGTNYNVFSNSNTNHPSIYAPTSAGTAGQPLLSNGSGAPVWGSYKFAFVSQSQYDALTTPDATTIYFIVDPN